MAEGGFYGGPLTQRPKSITFLQHRRQTSLFWEYFLEIFRKYFGNIGIFWKFVCKTHSRTKFPNLQTSSLKFNNIILADVPTSGQQLLSFVVDKYALLRWLHADKREIFLEYFSFQDLPSFLGQDWTS